MESMHIPSSYGFSVIDSLCFPYDTVLSLIEELKINAI